MIRLSTAGTGAEVRAAPAIVTIIPGARHSDIMACYMTQRQSLYSGLFAVLADAATLIIIQLVSPRLVARFRSPGGWNALLVGGVFVLFVIGVYLFRRLKATPQGSAEWLTRGRRTALALAFAFVISLVLAWQLGFFTSASQVDTKQMGEGGSASYFVFGPGAWLAFSLVYVLVFAFNVEPTIEPNRPGYWIAGLFGLLATAAMLALFAVQAQAIIPAAGAVWWALLAFLALILLLLPPRLEYLARTVGIRSPVAYGVVAVFLLLLASIAWRAATL